MLKLRQKNQKIKNKKTHTFKIYNIKDYKQANDNFIKTNYEEVPYRELLNKLKTSENYHCRIIDGDRYIFYGDIDNYNGTIIDFINIFIKFIKEKYDLEVDISNIKYTQNINKIGSYHYTIPRWNCTTSKLKEIHQHLQKIDEFKNNKKCIDTTIYSNHWFRYPNQKKGHIGDETTHEIVNGTLEDFIIEYIPKDSISIDNIIYLDNKIEIKKNDDIIELPHNNTKKNNYQMICKDEILSTSMSKPDLYKKVFDECYKQERFEDYEHWTTIGMAIKNIFDDEKEAHDLFNYYSAKGSNYEGYEKTIYKYKTFIKKRKSDGYTVATIYYYAIEDNKPKFIEIMGRNTLELGQTDFCKYLKVLMGYKFIYKVYGANLYKLYCYNGKYWQNDDTIMKKCISSELYNFLKMILVEIYWNSKEFNIMKAKIEKLKTISFKKDIIETYKEVGVNNEVLFDNKWWLLGFTNCVYDLQENKFKEYKYDDYITMTTGYEWREPTEEELLTVNNLIDKIMPNKDEKKLYLQIMSTALDGKCLEKFIIYNGSGGNGKGVINDLLLLALGNYGMIGNNAILFECSKTGCNPEKANMHKKRLVIFREPPEKRKFENSIIKELTGGGLFSARTLHEKETEKELNSTTIVECNKKPLFAEEPTNAETRRIIDLYFGSTFVGDKNQLNEEKNIYLANPYYKTQDFQQKHKYALLKILMDEYKIYNENNGLLQIPQSVEDRTKQYLELSCTIVQWFKDNYEFTNNKKDICKIKDVFDNFIRNEYYQNLTKMDKRKYNKTYFTEYIKTNLYFKNYYYDKYLSYTSVILYWKKKIDENEIINLFNIDE